MNWRWIDTGTEDGSTQMAIDQAMILEAKEYPQLTFRVYQWRPYCISLGYHQSENILDLDLCKEKHVDVVRRPTGGRAVFHAEELTYSAIVPFGIDNQLSSAQAIYQWISQGLASAIQSLGVSAKLEKRKLDFKKHYQSDESNSCFSAAARHEVMVDGKKLIGSAQRCYPWGVLQHGSILLGEAHLDLPTYFRKGQEETTARFKTSLKEKTIDLNSLMTEPILPADLSEAIHRELSSRSDLLFQTGRLFDREERLLAQLKTEYEIVSSKYVDQPLLETGI